MIFRNHWGHHGFIASLLPTSWFLSHVGDCWRICNPTIISCRYSILKKWKAKESFYVHRIHSPISFMVILNIAQRMEIPSFLPGKSSNSMMGHLNMGLNHSKVSVHRLKKSSSFNVFPQISIYLHICPNKNLLPLSDLSGLRKKKIGKNIPKKWGIPSQKGLPQGGLPDDFVFLRLFEPGSERRKAWGVRGGGYGDDLGMGMVYSVYCVYIYYRDRWFTKAIVHGKSQVEWCLVCIEILYL